MQMKIPDTFCRWSRSRNRAQGECGEARRPRALRGRQLTRRAHRVGRRFPGASRPRDETCVRLAWARWGSPEDAVLAWPASNAGWAWGALPLPGAIHGAVTLQAEAVDLPNVFLLSILLPPPSGAQQDF